MARRRLGPERRPRQAEEGRICAEDRCSTKLSRYNTADRCHRHRDTRYPRTRGKGPVKPDAAD